MKRVLSAIICLTMVLSFAVFAFPAYAETEGGFEYELVEGEAMITEYGGDGGAVTIPATIGGYPVTSIGDNALKGCVNVTSVTLAEGIESVGDNAFKDCTGLASVSLPDSLTSIGFEAFHNTAYYNDGANWVSGVLYIGKHLYRAKTNISGSYVVKDGTTEICNRAFFQCANLNSISIPDTVTEIHDFTFYNCYALRFFSTGNTVTRIGEGAFFGCSGMYSFTIGSAVTSIGPGAFYGCLALPSITIPDNVKEIEHGAFRYCKFTTFTIPGGIKIIPEQMFDCCNLLTSVTIPDTVTEIGNGAFSYCTSLASITLPESLVTIGENAFLECRTLSATVIPKSVTSIGKYAFRNCAAMNKIIIRNPDCEIYYNVVVQPSVNVVECAIPKAATIYGQEVSTAKEYADKNGNTFVPIVVESLAISSLPTKTDYLVGDTFDSTGLAVTAKYNDGKVEPAAASLSSPDMTTAGTKTVTVTYGGKTTSFEINVFAALATEISVTTLPTKTEYFVGDTFDSAGLVVTASFSDGTSDTVTASLSAPDMTTAGTKTVTVTYGGMTTSFDITVNAVVLTGLEVTTPPTKTEYFVGELPVFTGLVVTASYNNGTKAVVSPYAIGYTDMATPGIKIFTAFYGGKATSFNITVKAVELTGIAVTTLPTKTEYFVGDSFVSDGLVVTASYNNGTTKAVTPSLSSPYMLTAGTKTVTAIYENKATSFNITVNAVVVTEIAVTTLPTKLDYFVGDSFVSDGLVVTASFNNGTTDTVTAELSAPDMTTAGTKTITATFEGKTDTFDITVNAVVVTEISITTLPTKLNYFVGDSFVSDGLVVTASYNNGATEAVTASLSAPDMTAAGTKTITATYEGKTDTFDITVKAVELTGIAVTTLPTKLDYFVGDSFVSDGLVVTASYNNGTTEEVIASLSAPDMTTAGTKTVTATFEGKTTTFDITVKAVELTGIAVTTAPTKIDYFVGDSFVSDGIVVTASYNNGATEAVTASLSAPDMTAAGTKTVTVSYGDFTDSFSITVAVRNIVGDVDLSGSITIADALTLFKHVAGVEIITDSEALIVADVDGAAGVTIADALTLFKFVAGVISEF